MPSDAFFKSARIFNELDLFQREPNWLASFPDGADDNTIPRGELWVSIARARGPSSEPAAADRVLWVVHADQWVQEDEGRVAAPVIPPGDIIQQCLRYDQTSTGFGCEAELGPEEGSFVYYTWAELKLTPAEAKDLLRELSRRFQSAFPDREVD